MSNYKLIAVISLIFLGGCTSLPEKQNNIKVLNETLKETEEVETAIDPDVMYMLLAAELAGQREQYDIALEGYLEAAKRVGDVRLAERAAKIALYIKDLNRADEAVGLWLKKEPENLTARKIALLSALRKENKEAAVENVQILFDKDPGGFEPTLLELVQSLGSKGNVAFVYDVLEELSLKRPNEAIVSFVQSMLAMQLNSKVLAEQKIEKALTIDPDWEKALLFRAQIAAFSGDLKQAKAYLEDLADAYPENAKVKRLLAQVLIKSSEYEQAKSVYKDLIAANPDDNESRFALALVYLQLKQDEKAEPLFKELLSFTEWEEQSSFYLGRIAVRDNRVDEALVWFEKVTNGVFQFDASIAAISLLIKDQKYEAAKQKLQNLQPKNADQSLRVVLIEAELYNGLKEYAKTFDLLSEAIASSPEQKELLYTRALVAERIDKLDVMEQDLKKILEKTPDDVSALNALGYTLVDRTNRYEEARQYLEKALKLQPDEAVIIDSYGWLLFKMNNLELALEYLQRAYSLQQENEIGAHLAEVLWAMGRKAESKKLFDQLIKSAPDDEYLLDFQKRILTTE